jgi:hypothetical protein
MTRISYYDIHSNPLRIINLKNESTENHRYRCPGPARSRHLVHPRAQGPEEISDIESEITFMGDTACGGYPDICLYRIDTTFWRAEDRGGDVCGRDLVWTRKLSCSIHAYRIQLTGSCTAHSRVTVELYMRS